MTQQRVKVGQLGPLTKLAAGGQGVVFSAPSARMRYAKAVVYKEYKPVVLANVAVDVLEEMPAYLESLPFAEGMDLLSRVAWPCRLVEADNSAQVTGFVMPAIPDEFFIKMTMSSAVQSKTAEFQHLLNGDSFLARRGIPLTDRHRYELLAEAAEALTILHRHDIAVGDLSPKNLLFSLQPDRKVYFIDCDAMRLRSRSVSAQVETPDWEVEVVNPGEELATARSDAYKFGLLALRLLAGDQSTRDPNRLPAAVPAPVRGLVGAALSPVPAQRPRPGDWLPALSQAAARAATRAPSPPPRTTPPRGAVAPAIVTPAPPVIMPPPAGRRPWAPRIPTRVKVISALALLVVVVGFLAGKMSGDSGPSAAGNRAAAVATGPTSVTATIAVGAQPWGVAIDPTSANLFVTNSAGNSVSVIDTKTNVTGVVTAPGMVKPTAVAIDSAAGLAYVTNAGSASVLLINTRNGSFAGSIPVGAGPYGIAVDSASHTAFVTNFEADTVSVIDTRSRVVTATIRVGSHPYGVAVDPSSHSVFVANAGPPGAVDHTVSVIDPALPVVAATINVGNQPWGVAVDSDTRTAYVTNHADGTVSVIDIRTRAVTATLRVGLGPVGVAVDGPRKTVYVTNHGLDDVRTASAVSLIDTRTGKPDSSIRVGSRPHGVVVDPGNRTVYVTNFSDGTVSVIGD
ncbi:hypothetical protein ACIHAX_13055 [Nocardia sp. NPDC051929]|uniref:YVTN family beta-propeller repeat protein n=1 Tax=Nocardia sp. NPDC051929 TaxID=3364327 RepID=UPI0037C8397D